MNKYLTDIKLGDLFTRTGLISAKQVSEVVKTAGNKNLHFGQVLVKSGCLKQDDLSAGIAAQSAIRDRVVGRNAASRALTAACKKGISFEEALKSIMGTQPGTQPDMIRTNKIGELMVDAGLITIEQAQRAIAKSSSTGLPLGRILVSTGLIAEDILITILELQMRIRDGLLSREDALLIVASSSNLEGIKEKDEARSGQHTVRLGDLMVRAGVLSRTDVTNVLEVGLNATERTGELLIKFGFVTEHALDCALNLQQMVDNGFISVEQAAHCLRYVEANHPSTISEALVGLDMLSVPRSRSHGVNLDSTYGPADRAQTLPASSRAGRLIRALRSPPEPRLSTELGITYGALVDAYTRLATRHIYYDDYVEAEWLYERILAVRERMTGPFDRGLVTDLKCLTEVLSAQKKYGQAERSIRRALEILEKTRPYDGGFFATCLNMLAMIYFEQGFYRDAEPLLTRALTLKEMNYPADHPELADTLRDYARLLAKTDRPLEAEKMYYHARAILMRQENAEPQPQTFFEKLYVTALLAKGEHQAAPALS